MFTPAIAALPTLTLQELRALEWTAQELLQAPHDAQSKREHEGWLRAIRAEIAKRER